jgi:hypothetical protein
VQKITSDITDTFDPENPAQSDLLKELTLGRLIAARYLVAGRVFIVNAPAPLARAIIVEPPLPRAWISWLLLLVKRVDCICDTLEIPL